MLSSVDTTTKRLKMIMRLLFHLLASSMFGRVCRTEYITTMVHFSALWARNVFWADVDSVSQLSLPLLLSLNSFLQCG